MDSKTILAFGLMILIYIFFFQPTVPPQQPPKDLQTSEASKDPAPSGAQASPSRQRSASIEASKNAALLKRRLILENSALKVDVNGLGQVLDVTLKSYEKDFGQEARVSYSFGREPLNKGQLLAAEGEAQWQVQSASAEKILLVGKAEGLSFERSIQLSSKDPYVLEIQERASNLSRISTRLNPSIRLYHPVEYETGKPGFWSTLFKPQTEVQSLVFYLDGSLNRLVLQDVTNAQERKGAIQYGGFTSRYFFLGAVPLDTSMNGVSFLRLPSKDVEASFSFTEKQIPPGEQTSFTYQLYLGPKNLAYLNPLGSGLGEVVEYGSWIGPISRVLLTLLNFFHSLIPNFGVAIILLTLLVKALLFPLSYKAAVSARRLQVLAPKMQDIRNRYKDDKFRMQQEVMTLYKTEKVNPFGGCLPLLLQFPIFIALYRLFFVSIEMRHAPFFGWIKDLSAHDPLLITPIVMVALMWFQQKITPMPPAMEDNEAVQMQRAMLKWMPLMFGGLMLFLPAGLNLYFLTNAAFSIVQQIYLNRHLEMKYPLPASPKAKQA